MRDVGTTEHRDEVAEILDFPESSVDLSKSVPEQPKVQIENPIEESLKVATPAWPLQNTVAVNPFWFNRDKHLVDVFSQLEPVLHQSMFMPLEFYHKKHQAGDICDSALSRAIELAQSIWPDLPKSTGEFESWARSIHDSHRNYETFAETVNAKQDFHQIVIEDIGKYCAGYFDDRQAIIRYPWQSGSFWHGWFEAQKYDKAMLKSGISGFDKVVKRFHGKKPKEVIEIIFDSIGLSSSAGKLVYMQRLLATTIGWASQFKYVEWQKSLGYQVDRDATTLDFLAVRMIYDYAVFNNFVTKSEFKSNSWVRSLNSIDHASANSKNILVAPYIWQLAFELSFQNRIIGQLENAQSDRQGPGRYQMVFCIDVRSEMIRRHIESLDDDFQTIGFAGFFGIPLDYKKTSQKTVGHRLPVLLTPAYHADEKAKDPVVAAEVHSSNLIYSYFKNLRKAPFSSFLYVELFGILAVGNIAFRTLKTLAAKVSGRKVPSKFESKSSEPCMETAKSLADSSALSLDEKVGRAAAVLGHLGLKEDFGKLIFFCGHGSTTTNNALASALDCGACGGHAGDINARFVADLLNDSEVRRGLIDHEITIPEKTWFVAAVHETVTDAVYLLDDEKIPSEYRAEVEKVKAQLKTATARTVKERNFARSDVMDHSPCRRATNWSEVRPEWGLAGNACFIVAPRSRTKGVNLSSRSFLHDYDWRGDSDFATLELIMTAPMVVTNWINLQYYGSVTAPRYFGSGNKVLHNVTNENGVVEGNGGDLRIGLSMQSVHDGNEFVHEPLRLSVFIEAPRFEIEKIIEKHQVVKDLVDNEWLHIIHIEPGSGSFFRRLSGGVYERAKGVTIN